MTIDAAPLPDADARRRIAGDLGSSLVVVAGAGTGKTTALVERVTELVRRGRPVRDIAAITFTEAAAAELRLRLRSALAGGDDNRDNVDDAVDDAAICTLHAFAQRILVEHAVAAGLPPGFEVLDQVAERADFSGALSGSVDELLGDPSARDVLLCAFVLGLGDGALADVAWTLHCHWDRLEDGGLDELSRRVPPPGSPVTCDLGPVIEAVGRAVDLAAHCVHSDDLLRAHLLGTMADTGAALAELTDDPLAALPLLAGLPTLRCTYGQADHWRVDVRTVRDATAAAEAARQQALAEVRERVALELLARLASFTVDHARRRAADGRLTFHDLLVHARRLLRGDEAARLSLRRRYPVLLIDEFQDTDPIQVELVTRLVCAEGGAELATADPGSLFVVGDPKQSIYRFRRADIDLFERVCAAVGDELVLGANFRSVPGIVDFANVVFGDLFGPGGPGQAAHHALEAMRAALPPTATRARATQLRLAGMEPEEPASPAFAAPPVMVAGGALDGSVPEVRRVASRHIAATATLAVSQGWAVSDPEDPSAPARPATWSDIAVLIPTRTSLPPLEEAFDAAGVPFRLEGAALLWGSDEVNDVLCALRAADDPSDAVSVLAALRSPGLGCGDDDLVTWVSAGGHWDPRAEVPAGAEDHPVQRAMAVLLELHRRRWWSEPSDLVRTAIAELRSFEVAFAHRRPRDHWQRLRWLADQARLFDEARRGTLHDFLVWAELQRAEDGRASTLGPPDPDDDAVRVMTVHGAKGLEFPVVMLAGLERETGSGYRAAPVLWDDDGQAEVRFTKDLSSAGHAPLAERDKELDALERVRLLYVAMTRARDALVLALHHKADGKPTEAERLEEICRAHPLLWRRLSDLDDIVPHAPALPVDDGAQSTADAQEWTDEVGRWEAERTALLARLRTMPLATASRLSESGPANSPSTAPSAEPGWVEPDGAGPRGAETGLRVGRAVHQVLAAVDLATRPGDPELESECDRRAAANGVADHAGDVGHMVAAALSSAIVRRAATRPHHREMYVSVPVGGGVFEGFVDLLVEDDDGLVVVDYKTDRLGGGESVGDLVAHYRPQVGAYASALEQATGFRVARVVLLFVGGREPIEHVIDGAGLEAAMADANNRIEEIVGAL